MLSHSFQLQPYNMNALLILSALAAVAYASEVYSTSYEKKSVHNDKTGNTVGVMGYDQNRDGLADKHDTNRDGHPDGGYYGAHRYGHYGGYNAVHAYDRHGLTVPVMGADQNNDGVSDYNDRNRDGHRDHHGYGYHGAYAGHHGYAGFGHPYGGFRHY